MARSLIKASLLSLLSLQRHYKEVVIQVLAPLPSSMNSVALGADWTSELSAHGFERDETTTRQVMDCSDGDVVHPGILNMVAACGSLDLG